MKTDFRYPLAMNYKALENCDVLFIGHVVNECKLPPQSGDDTYSYSEAIRQLYEEINECR